MFNLPFPFLYFERPTPLRKKKLFVRKVSRLMTQKRQQKLHHNLAGNSTQSCDSRTRKLK